MIGEILSSCSLETHNPSENTEPESALSVVRLFIVRVETQSAGNVLLLYGVRQVCFGPSSLVRRWKISFAPVLHSPLKKTDIIAKSPDNIDKHVCRRFCYEDFLSLCFRSFIILMRNTPPGGGGLERG